MEILTKKGFTLVELLVTITILATLLAVLLPNLMGSRQRARDSKKVQELEAVKNALRLYYNDNQTYPAGDGEADLSSELEEYLPGVAGIGYTYYGSGDGESFSLCTFLEQSGGDSDIDSQVACGALSVSVCGLDVGTTQDGLFAVCAN